MQAVYACFLGIMSSSGRKNYGKLQPDSQHDIHSLFFRTTREKIYLHIFELSAPRTFFSLFLPLFLSLFLLVRCSTVLSSPKLSLRLWENARFFFIKNFLIWGFIHCQSWFSLSYSFTVLTWKDSVHTWVRRERAKKGRNEMGREGTGEMEPIVYNCDRLLRVVCYKVLPTEMINMQIPREIHRTGTIRE